MEFDLNKLTEPASKLIESVSNAIGVLYEPTRIRKKAKAEADAKIIEAETDIKISAIKKDSNEAIDLEIDSSDISKRAAYRMHFQEIKFQENIENIIGTTVGFLNNVDKIYKGPDSDYLMFFFENCKSINNSYLQKIWAKILANASVNEYHVTKQTLNVLKILSSKDVHLFTDYSAYLLEIDGYHYRPRINFSNKGLASQGISRGRIGHLQDIGLLRIDYTYYFTNEYETKIKLQDGEEIFVYPKNRLHVKSERLTLAGEQILKFIDSKESPEFIDEFIEYLKPHVEIEIKEDE